MATANVPVNLGGYQYTKVEANSVCAARGQKLCEKNELLKSDFCSCGWANDVTTPGYPMANGDKTGRGGCGGANGGQVWRDCGGTDWLNSDGTIFNTNKLRPDGQRHASAFCCDSQGNDISTMLVNIQNLQTTEQDLIRQLDSYTSSSGFVASDPKVKSLVTNINTIADSRISLFQTIVANANVLQKGVSQSRVDLVSQLTLLQVVEDQLNQAKSKIDQLHNQNDTKMRMVEINTYYGERYEAQSNLMKNIILFCLPVLVLFILKKKNILPETISNYCIGIVMAIGVFMIIRNMWDIFTRSNMYFNQYDWRYEFADTTKPPTIWQYNKENFFKYFNLTELLQNLMSSLGICVAGTCCSDGQTYDSEQMKCLVPPRLMNKLKTKGHSAGSGNRQGFTSGKGLNGTHVASYFTDEKDEDGLASPFSYGMDFATL